ncbi:MAG TPA: hypothetical protein VGB00_15835 [Pyrinomonadaceae bacterium]|jgi:hypothetical protein
MKTAVKIFPWIILAITFLALGYFYGSIAGEILIYRSFGGDTVFAPKSLFTVFRVPLIEVVCALMVEVMRRKFSRSESGKPFAPVWNILLYTVTFKSLFQTFEFIASFVYESQTYADVFFYATIAAVIAGIFSVVFKGRDIFRNLRREDWKAAPLEKVVLGVLLVSYLFLAFAPTFIYKSA